MKDERVRPAKQKGRNKQYDHRKMDGVAVKIDEEFILPSGAKTMAPGQSGVAGEDINCRCYLSYELRKVDEESVKSRLEASNTLRTMKMIPEISLPRRSIGRSVEITVMLRKLHGILISRKKKYSK